MQLLILEKSTQSIYVKDKGKKILFIYPDYRDGLMRPQLPVGLGYIARSLENAGIEYRVIDLNIDSFEDLVRKIEEFCPEYIGVSMMSYRCGKTYELLCALKNQFPFITLIAGGPHITVNREKALEECPAIDIGIVGEGEISMVEALCGSTISLVKGALYREGQEVRYAGDRDFIKNLDEIPFPTYNGFKIARYSNDMRLASSRGCPYQCVFCGAPKILGQQWRKRSAGGMMEELAYWFEKGYQNFNFNDSNFAMDRNRVVSFCEEIIKSNMDVQFTVEGLRADHVNKDLLEKMRRAGFVHLTYGIESGSDNVLRKLRKGASRQQMESAIATSTALGYRVALFFVIGSPGERAEDIRQSFQLALKYPVALALFFNLTPIPGTEFYKWITAQGYRDELNGWYPEENFGFSKQALFGTDVMEKDQLTRWIKKARRLERQIQYRYRLQIRLQHMTGKTFIVKNSIFNTVAWFLSCNGTKIGMSALRCMIKIPFACFVRMAICLK
ncbi:MAG: B12-binding domain-containing radical SAM protein [Candidatus Brocadiaceae bacterium]|nr:B12-binding domain-containing radical SAM protein [Candidatus Brocadiaceae bacterium]